MQGCNERNISAVVEGKDAARALKAVHAAFWLSSKVLTIGVVGCTGRVGSSLLQTILDQVDILLDHFDIDIQVRGVINSTKMLLSENLNSTLRNSLLSMARKSAPSPGSSGNNKTANVNSSSYFSFEEIVVDQGFQKPIPANHAEFFDYLCTSPSPHVIMIDCSNSQSVAEMHPKWIRGGAHVITANKKALSSSIDLYNEVFAAVNKFHRSYLSEATIGSSVPVMTTLNHLLYSSDAIHSIVGLMSMSAGQILSGVIDEGLTFSQSISRAHANQLFEDDVFIDLEGTEAFASCSNT